MEVHRQLLFGILAVQTGMIDQGQHTAAFQAYIRDQGRTLGEHLVIRGDLDDKQCGVVEDLVADHLQKHGGDVEKSLSRVSVTPSTLESLETLGDEELTRILPHVGSASNQDDDDTEEGHRFRVLRRHAKGGLGIVFIALDAELNREVVLKRIAEPFADDPESRARFLLEAEITGGLEHPGIVPVYGLGTYRSGRPYYAMRFIQGDNLKETISAFHNNPTLKNDPGSKSLALRQLLRRLLDVCNAIDYAHTRGVLHRDIKPSNIIVGKHGETLVVDWGLAKARGKAEPRFLTSSEQPLMPSWGSGSAETLPNSVVGTPAYMSPEQAAGALDQLGPPSDIYSLGATLYCVLTGRPPFLKSDDGLSEFYRAVREGRFPSPRSIKPEIDLPLEAVCLKAMALKPEDRYRSAKALADDIERWAADEPVSAWPEPWSYRARRWSKRHRTFVTSAVLGLVFATITTGLYFESSRRVAYQTDLRNRVRVASSGFLNARSLKIDPNHKVGWRKQAVKYLDESVAAKTDVISQHQFRDEYASYLGAFDLELTNTFDATEALGVNKLGVRTLSMALHPNDRWVAIAPYLPLVGTYALQQIPVNGKFVQGHACFPIMLVDRLEGRTLRTILIPTSESEIDRFRKDHYKQRIGFTFSPDGRYLVGAAKGRAFLVDLEQNAKNPVFWEPHEGATVTGFAFSGEPLALYTTSAEGKSIRRWDLTGPEPLLTAERHFNEPGNNPSGSVGSIEKIPLSNDFLIGDAAQIVRLDAKTLDLASLVGKPPLSHFTLDPSGDSFWMASKAGVEFRAFAGPSRRIVEHAEDIDFKFTTNSAVNLLVTWAQSERGADRGFQLWDIASGASLAVLPCSFQSPSPIQFTPDGRQLVVLQGNILSTYTIGGADIHTSLAPSHSKVLAATWLPDGSKAVSVSIERLPDGQALGVLTLSDPKNPGHPRRLAAAITPSDNRDVAHSVAISSDNRRAIVAFGGPNLALVNLETGAFEAIPLSAQAFGSQARFVPSDGSLWAFHGSLERDEQARVITTTVGPGSIAPWTEVWRDADSQMTSGLPGLSCIATARNFVILGSNQGRAQLFDADHLKLGPVNTLVMDRMPTRSVAIRSDASTIAAGNAEGSLFVFRPNNPKPDVVTGEHRGAIFALTFNPEGTELASGGNDRGIRIWKVGPPGTKPTLKLTLPPASATIRGLAYSPDGKRLLVVVEGECAPRVWNLERLEAEFSKRGLSE